MGFRLAARMVIGAVWLGLLVNLLQAGRYSALVDPAGNVANRLATINQPIWYGLLIVRGAGAAAAVRCLPLAAPGATSPAALGTVAALV